jgi:hypothetical protein
MDATVTAAVIAAVPLLANAYVSWLGLRQSQINSAKLDEATGKIVGVHKDINSRMDAALTAKTAVGNLQGRRELATEQAAIKSNVAGP